MHKKNDQTISKEGKTIDNKANQKYRFPFN